jgi:hypothetical protein
MGWRFFWKKDENGKHFIATEAAHENAQRHRQLSLPR